MIIYTCPACGYKQDEWGCTATWCGFFKDWLRILLDYDDDPWPVVLE